MIIDIEYIPEEINVNDYRYTCDRRVGPGYKHVAAHTLASGCPNWFNVWVNQPEYRIANYNTSVYSPIGYLRLNKRV